MARHLMTVCKKDIRKWSYSWKGAKNQDKLTVNECVRALSNSGLSRTSTESCRDAWARLVLLLSGVCMWPFAWERGKLSIHTTVEFGKFTPHWPSCNSLFYFMLDLILLAIVASRSPAKLLLEVLMKSLAADVVRLKVSELWLTARKAEKTQATYEGIGCCLLKVF